MMARLGDYIQEECRPLGSLGAQHLRLIGVSNEHGLHVSGRDLSDDISNYQRIEKNWFAYNPMRVNVGSIGLADDESKIGFTSPDYTVFSCKDGLDPHYLLHFLKSEYGLEAIARNCSGAVRKRLYFNGLAEIELPIPNIDEQRALVKRIHEIVDSISFISKQNSDRHELPKLERALLQAAIQGELTADWRAAHPDAEPARVALARICSEKARLIALKVLRPKDGLPKITNANTPFKIPKTWEWCSLGEIAMDVTYGTSQKAHIEAEGIPVLRMGNITIDGRINFANLKYVSPRIKDLPRLFLNSGDIVFNRTNSYELVGKSAVFRRNQQFTLASYLIRIRLHEELIPEYVAYLINSPICRTMFIEPNIVQQNGQANFNGSKLKAIPIPLPPVAEQAAIVERIEALSETCRALVVEINHSRTDAADLLQAVLRDTFSSSEAASALRLPVEAAREVAALAV
ncbi:restriction endonuclease subunit S [Bradyrhizobium sp. AUGA SZCCT0283]|uniref:restriction endonuclease subunit S n=1 Tax=Bradyrhizobium sp. AUGA SZCCT0283 TaxID=2807671 RepID=UPI001BA4EBFC|nr:restriction endonuclease subunit S [Bradyrhizobium sp. AUGA SZCCT0283]MBR1279765.1 restriction endonuclease subunit S [Bradyrhizobium sp. AUGA SZCCT0283]